MHIGPHVLAQASTAVLPKQIHVADHGHWESDCAEGDGLRRDVQQVGQRLRDVQRAGVLLAPMRLHTRGQLVWGRGPNLRPAN